VLSRVSTFSLLSLSALAIWQDAWIHFCLHQIIWIATVWLSCHSTVVSKPGTSLVSTSALHTFLSTSSCVTSGGILKLQGLGLNAEHCKVISQQLPTSWTTSIDLRMHPSIGEEGCEMLLRTLNRHSGIVLGESHWDATCLLVVNMNRSFGRGQFHVDGVFPSKVVWLDFLAELSVGFGDSSSESFRLDSILYAFLENPHYVCV